MTNLGTQPLNADRIGKQHKLSIQMNPKQSTGAWISKDKRKVMYRGIFSNDPLGSTHSSAVKGGPSAINSNRMHPIAQTSLFSP
jgi:hypothetical protein